MTRAARTAHAPLGLTVPPTLMIAIADEVIE
jgi:hypothetical protein